MPIGYSEDEEFDKLPPPKRRVYQKGEQCRCGDWVNIESFSEATVLEECERFRIAHQGHQCPPLPYRDAESIDAWNSYRDKKIGDEGPLGFDPRQRRYDDLGIGEKAGKDIGTLIGEKMVAKEIGELTIPVYAGDPDRTDYQYALAVSTGPLKETFMVHEGWDWRTANDSDEMPTVFDDAGEAEKARRNIELAYQRLGVSAVVIIKVRSVKTYIGDWQTG